MNEKVEMAQFMTRPTHSDKKISTILGNIFEVILITIVGSEVLLLTFYVRQVVDIHVLKYTVVVAVGLIAGFAARRLLIANTHTLKLLVALTASLLSLSILYIFTNGFLGIGLFDNTAITPDWPGLIQFGLASLAVWLVLQAYKSRSEFEIIAEPIDPTKISNSLLKPNITGWISKIKLLPGRQLIQKISKVVTEKKERLTFSKTNSLKVLPRYAKTRASFNKIESDLMSVSSSPRLRNKKSVRVKKTWAKKKVDKDIKFVGTEEHSCPYCLEVVEAHDPRGVKICSICKTYHHADCWGITGTCQIPHAHE